MSKRKKSSGMGLQLDGNVYFYEHVNGKKVKHTINSKLVLELLMHAIYEGMNLLEKKHVKR